MYSLQDLRSHNVFIRYDCKHNATATGQRIILSGSRTFTLSNVCIPVGTHSLRTVSSIPVIVSIRRYKTTTPLKILSTEYPVFVNTSVPTHIDLVYSYKSQVTTTFDGIELTLITLDDPVLDYPLSRKLLVSAYSRFAPSSKDLPFLRVPAFLQQYTKWLVDQKTPNPASRFIDLAVHSPLMLDILPRSVERVAALIDTYQTTLYHERAVQNLNHIIALIKKEEIQLIALISVLKEHIRKTEKRVNALAHEISRAREIKTTHVSPLKELLPSSDVATRKLLMHYLYFRVTTGSALQI